MIKLAKGDITKIGCEAVVNPANSLGVMGGGVALAMKNAGGHIIEEEAKNQAPIPVGSAVLTTAGSMPATYVIHAPTMERPAEKSDTKKVRAAVSAALEEARRADIRSVAVPGMGTGTGGVSASDAAKAISDEIVSMSKHFDQILIIANRDLYDSFEREFRKRGMLEVSD